MRRAAGAFVLCVLAPAIAFANGRPPATTGVFMRPGDDQALYVRVTFGLLVSHDAGCTFRWVCEKSIGYGGEFDPKYAIATDGTIFATTFTGLRVSRDGGCTWTTATSQLPAADPGRIADRWIDAIDIAPTGDVWVATAESAGANDVYRSTDNGVTFTPRGLPSATIWWKSIKVAKSDPQRVYATGYQVAPTARAFLERTDTAGASWTEKPLPATVLYGSTPLVHVSAVDPANPDHLFLTSIEANPPRGDRLYRSTDGGTTFTEVLATTDPIRDVVFRTGGTVLAATMASGTFESRAGGGGPFVKLGETRPNGPDLAPPQLGCLAQRPNGELVGCGANWHPDYMAVGRTNNPVTWQKLFRFVELSGPLQCAPGTTTHTDCEPQWPALAQQFGVTGPPAVCGGSVDAPPAIDGPPNKGETGCCDAGAPGSGASLLGLGVFVAGRRRRRR
ncbi:MAG: hypothetical protein H0T42_08785 [Deltaproteobacteria bacterium]|nr:hypothetical protein [Deltaproteobacteria bacterium]